MTLACFQVASSCILPSIITAPLPSGIAARILAAKRTSSTGSGLNTRLAIAICLGCKRPSADATEQEGVAELRLAGDVIRKIAERAIERFQPMGLAGVDHFRDGVMPQILLHQPTLSLPSADMSSSTP